MGIGSEDDGRWITAPKLFGDMGLRLGPHLAHDPVPLVVGKPGRIFPAFDLALERGVGPQMMAVRGEMKPVGRGGEALRKERLEAQSSVLSDQSSGKARLVRVEAR